VSSIFFATDRRESSQSPTIPFSGDRGKVSYGICDISIPFSHKAGTIERPSVSEMQLYENPNKHISLHKLLNNRKADFFSNLKQSLAESRKKRILIFIHGYNTSFNQAAYLTAQLKYDLNFKGPAIFYSWPSQSKAMSYPIDVSNIHWSQPNIKRFLTDIAWRTRPAEIYVIAHSLGTHGLTNALKELAVEQPAIRKRFKEIILAAPDIDRDIFKRDIAPLIVTRKTSITIYASSNDYALKISKGFHGYSRVGDSKKGVVIIKGIETIDSTNIGSSFIGHSYHAESKTILSDIAELIHKGKRAAQRKTLRMIQTSKGKYWLFPKPPEKKSNNNSE
jgi:esterase/lipase superfamily enzyme